MDRGSQERDRSLDAADRGPDGAGNASLENRSSVNRESYRCENIYFDIPRMDRFFSLESRLDSGSNRT
uniref:Uncharacterized protein n=1 Tax=Candidatus Kentrum eta TaxID=2126337 RepID=A0A450VD44_9GAMM|nr:MAG: hypothetical protein BECKH772A_GA0070896_101053 [Candidatus Kentron sp. H]VFJ97092.1 MAG: hypothetical protein BECKH772B_GA0070898_101043 [Candidatus Kentron sp. H]VFK02713.1 MAG: hypothetical protein BECKH772C_GA0070978_101003 [Candidatus Kentron sp. H]